MSAKEMFEKLGFNFRKELYKNDVLIQIQFDNNDGSWITISEKEIEYVESHNPKANIPIKLLPAINKILEELRWNK